MGKFRLDARTKRLRKNQEKSTSLVVISLLIISVFSVSIPLTWCSGQTWCSGGRGASKKVKGQR